MKYICFFWEMAVCYINSSSVSRPKGDTWGLQNKSPITYIKEPTQKNDLVTSSLQTSSAIRFERRRGKGNRIHWWDATENELNRFWLIKRYIKWMRFVSWLIWKIKSHLLILLNIKTTCFLFSCDQSRGLQGGSGEHVSSSTNIGTPDCRSSELAFSIQISRLYLQRTLAATFPVLFLGRVLIKRLYASDLWRT